MTTNEDTSFFFLPDSKQTQSLIYVYILRFKKGDKITCQELRDEIMKRWGVVAPDKTIMDVIDLMILLGIAKSSDLDNTYKIIG